MQASIQMIFIMSKVLEINLLLKGGWWEKTFLPKTALWTTAKLDYGQILLLSYHKPL